MYFIECWSILIRIIGPFLALNTCYLNNIVHRTDTHGRYQESGWQGCRCESHLGCPPPHFHFPYRGRNLAEKRAAFPPNYLWVPAEDNKHCRTSHVCPTYSPIIQLSLILISDLVMFTSDFRLAWFLNMFHALCHLCQPDTQWCFQHSGLGHGGYMASISRPYLHMVHLY